MNRMKFEQYSEPKSHRFKRLVWFFCNLLVFPLLGAELRAAFLRLFGAKTGIHVLVYRSVKIYAPWNLETGDNVCFGPRVDVFSKDKIVIGSGVVVSQDSYLCTASHDITSCTMDSITSPIVIGDNCWIAARAMVLPGVTIGEGAVVGACAVVAKDVQPWTVSVGNPARVVGKRELLAK